VQQVVLVLEPMELPSMEQMEFQAVAVDSTMFQQELLVLVMVAQA
jgi:hypothetical protein